MVETYPQDMNQIQAEAAQPCLSGYALLWKVGDEIKTYQFNTVTLGLGPGPYLAIRCLTQLQCQLYGYGRVVARPGIPEANYGHTTRS